MTGAEILAYLNHKTYLIKFRHDGYFVAEYVTDDMIDWNLKPEEVLLKIMNGYMVMYGDGEEGLDSSELLENQQKFIWEQSQPLRSFEEFDDMLHAYEIQELDEEDLGFGYQCGYGDYRALLNFETKTIERNYDVRSQTEAPPFMGNRNVLEPQALPPVDIYYPFIDVLADLIAYYRTGCYEESLPFKAKLLKKFIDDQEEAAYAKYIDSEGKLERNNFKTIKQAVMAAAFELKENL